jgi:hypothetical protein
MYLRPRPRPSDFGFAGVHFALTGPGLRRWSPPSLAVTGARATRVFAEVELEVHSTAARRVLAVPQAPSGPPRAPAVTWRWQAAELELEVEGVRVALQRVGAQRFRGEAWLGAGLRPFERILAPLACALAYELGGAVLHAASVIWREGAWAFIGPSGAGKTTACQHVGGRVYSLDRLLLWPASGPELRVSALPSGRELWELGVLPKALSVPLHGLFRVRHGGGTAGARVETPTAARTFVDFREAVFFGGADVAEHHRLLENVEQWCDRGVLRTFGFDLGVAQSTVRAVLGASALPVGGAFNAP